MVSISDSFEIVFSDLVKSVESRCVDHSWIIRVDVALSSLESLGVERVRSVQKFTELVTHDFFSNSCGQGVLHSHDLKLTVFLF